MGWNLTKTLVQSIYNYPTSKIYLKQRQNNRIAYWSLIVVVLVVLVEELVVSIVRVVLDVVLFQIFLTRYHHTIDSNHIKRVIWAFQLKMMIYST